MFTEKTGRKPANLVVGVCQSKTRGELILKLGFIIPAFPHEKRVALLPEHIGNFNNEIVVENGFGRNLGIDDEEYIMAGCLISDRETIFSTCEAVFSLKLLQPSDYPYIKKGQIIIGWTHPSGSGKEFMESQAKPKGLVIVDLDNTRPCIYYNDHVIPIDWLKSNFIYRNSFIAGLSATYHAILSFGMIPTSSTRVAILAPGNVSQGAFSAISKWGADVRLFYRKTMHEFKADLESFDIIISGIEVDRPDLHILTLEDQKRLKKNCLVIDAAADAGNAIEGSHYTSIDNPIYVKDNVHYYVVNNAPSIFYRDSSRVISSSFSRQIYDRDVQVYFDLIEEYLKKQNRCCL